MPQYSSYNSMGSSVEEGEITDESVTVAKLKKSVGIGMFARGTYTGDGSTDQGITGLGFQPDYVCIQGRTTTDRFEKHTGDTNTWRLTPETQEGLEANRIISLDTDGFSVSDNSADHHPNSNGATYTYIAMKEVA